MFTGRNTEINSLRNHYSRHGRVAQIGGVRGIGKTTLALSFANASEDLFPGGRDQINACFTRNVGESVRETLAKPRTEAHLLIIDDVELADHDAVHNIFHMLETHPLLSVLLVGETAGPLPEDALSLILDGLSPEDFKNLLQDGILDPVGSTDEIDKLYNTSAGNPTIATAANGSLQQGWMVLKQFQKALQDFNYDAIPPAATEDTATVPEAISVSACSVNEELLRRIKSDPAILRSLTPRKFEETVAELLSRQGYSVELTPASGDGGVDIYAAKKNGLGDFLYLVECKRWNPPNNVGVQVVRSLHGVVQQKRATAGIVATTSFFTKGAKAFQQELKHQLHLRNYIELQKWLGLI